MAMNAVLYDSTMCVGCRECESACAKKWGLPYDEKIAAEERLSAAKLTTIRTVGERYVRKLCMHCLEPTCASVCPVGAFQKTKAGQVVYDATRCIGCRYCMQACPFQVPVYEWSSAAPLVRKCDGCHDRCVQGQPTACSEFCPVGATITGERNDLIRQAQARIAESPQQYYPRVYGVEEVGGTSVLMLAATPLDEMGFPKNLPHEALPHRTAAILDHVPDIAALGGVLLGGVYWLTKRREDVARAERPLSSRPAANSSEETRR